MLERVAANLTPRPPRTLFVGSFPPRECGIATFTKDVVDSFDSEFGISSAVIALDEPGGEVRNYKPGVVARLSQDDRSSYRRAAEFANEYPAELVNVQHEYGLFGGPEGSMVSRLPRSARKSRWSLRCTPCCRTRRPSIAKLRVASAISPTASSSFRKPAKTFSSKLYGVDPDKTHVIHHGVPDVPFRSTDAAQSVVRCRAAHGHLDVRFDQPRQRSRVRESKRCAKS